MRREVQRERRDRDAATVRPPSATSQAAIRAEGPAAQGRREALEAEIQLVEGELAALGEEINQASAEGDLDSIRALGERFEELRSLADALWEEWTA